MVVLVGFGYEVWTEVFGEVDKGWDGEVWEESVGGFEEGLDGVGEALDVGVWGCFGHYVQFVQSQLG